MNNILHILLKLGVALIVGIIFFYVPSRIFPDSLVYAQSCQLPAQVPNVAITFPSCVLSTCNFTQGSCSWGSVSGATKMQVTITEIETGTQVLSQQVDASVTSQVFSVKETNTYKCDVSAINACGTGPTGTSSLLCKVDAGVTLTPTTPPAPTIPVVTTFIPPKTLPVTGNNMPLLLGVVSISVVFIGLSLYTISK